MTTDDVIVCCCFVSNISWFCDSVLLCIDLVHRHISSGFDRTCFLLRGLESTAIVNNLFERYTILERAPSDLAGPAFLRDLR